MSDEVVKLNQALRELDQRLSSVLLEQDPHHTQLVHSYQIRMNAIRREVSPASELTTLLEPLRSLDELLAVLTTNAQLGLASTQQTKGIDILDLVVRTGCTVGETAVHLVNSSANSATDRDECSRRGKILVQRYLKICEDIFGADCSALQTTLAFFYDSQSRDFC